MNCVRYDVAGRVDPDMMGYREAPVGRSFEGKESEMETTHPDADLKSRHVTPVDLVNLKLGRFSLDTLVAMLLRAGKNIELVVR